MANLMENPNNPLICEAHTVLILVPLQNRCPPPPLPPSYTYHILVLKSGMVEVFDFKYKGMYRSRRSLLGEDVMQKIRDISYSAQRLILEPN